MDVVLIIIYWIAGYWAYGYVFYEGKIVIAGEGEIFWRKVAQGLVLGWLWIPVAIIKKIFRLK